MTLLKRYLRILFGYSERARAAMVLGLDLGLCVLAVLLAYSLRIGEWRIFTLPVLLLSFLTCSVWLLVAPVQGVYRSLLRFSGLHTIRDLGTTCTLLAGALTVLLVFVRFEDSIPRTLSLLVPLILFIMVATSRMVLAGLLRETLYARSARGRRRALVYGAGVAGRELTLSIKDDPEFEIVGFVDDSAHLRGRRLDRHKIWHSSELSNVLRTRDVNEILLAIPSASRSRRRAIVEEVREIAPGMSVRSLPNMSEIASGRISVNDLRRVPVEDLLGRDQVEPDARLMAANVTGRCVMVTGGGGSIGSELCRQILMQRPSRLVVAERSELALYTVEAELRAIRERESLDVVIDTKLVDVSDRADLERVFRDCAPSTVFHAAAYKHVPLVEADPIAGIRNNVLGTYNCCVLGERYGVRNFTLVSTDKAVRPTSVMGGSKRVCELVVQSRAAAQTGTVYSAVRFGNVLGSSGSVVPLFRKQIAAGGPVTVTHRDATRFFMTVSEAAQLVVQAGAMAAGGEIFLLDMGEAVRIYDLATLMIQLSGLTVVGENGPDGDIEIVETGLRPGEKVHEELLIDNLDSPTSHPRIVKASEPYMPLDVFDARFTRLLRVIEQRDAGASLQAMHELVRPEAKTELIGLAGTTAGESPNGKHKAGARSGRIRAGAPDQAFGL